MERMFVLFSLEGCPYCRKAEKFLDEQRIKYRKIEVPREHEKRTMLKEISGQVSVPVLIEVIGSKNQDDDIIEWVRELGKC
ncbi:MAG TPA: glutaredoxin [Candidatus Nanoarchaeia archaeon]|nr:glutaredoxin [Candidatus Nanoarchaeia archaeon]